MLDVAVGNAEAADVAGVEAGVGGGFQYGAAETAHQDAFLDRDDQRTLANGSQDRRSIERLDESGVDDAEVDAVGRQPLGRFVAGADEAPQATNIPSAPQWSTSALPNSIGGGTGVTEAVRFWGVLECGDSSPLSSCVAAL